MGSKSKPLKVILFLGSTRQGRMGARVATFMKNHLTQKGLEVDFFDPVELKMPILEQPIHFYQDQSKVPGWLTKLNERVLAADGYVLVSAEYNNSIPPALSNMMNHFPPLSYAFKPSLIITYSMGRLGGSVAGSHLRSFTSILGCPSVPLALAIPEVMRAFDESGKPQQDHLDGRATKALDQLIWMASAFKDKTLKDGSPKHLM